MIALSIDENPAPAGGAVGLVGDEHPAGGVRRLARTEMAAATCNTRTVENRTPRQAALSAAQGHVEPLPALALGQVFRGRVRAGPPPLRPAVGPRPAEDHLLAQ